MWGSYGSAVCVFVCDAIRAVAHPGSYNVQEALVIVVRGFPGATAVERNRRLGPGLADRAWFFRLGGLAPGPLQPSSKELFREVF
jgi:hypothetical protein